MRRRVVGLGLCVVDHLYCVESLETAGERTRWIERVVAPGGMTGNALLQAAALGCPAELLAVIGNDAEGRFLRRSLRDGGVMVHGLVRWPKHPTTVAVVLVDAESGERRFVVPDRRALERTAPPLPLADVAKASVLLVDGHHPAQALRAARLARRGGTPVVGDFSRPLPAVERLLPYVDHPIVGEAFARAYGDGDLRRALRRLRDRTGGSPIVTQGERGGLFLRAGKLRRFRSPRVRVRDTTGAGDAFHGAFAAALHHGLSFEVGIELAARAAARACRTLGANADPLRGDEVAALRRKLS